MNEHKLNAEMGISSCKFIWHLFHCSTKNHNLRAPFSEVNIMMSLKDCQELEFCQK